MRDINYSEIRPLVIEAGIENEYLFTTFKCTKTDKMFFTSTYLHFQKKSRELPQNEQTAKGFIKKVRRIILPLLGKTPLKKLPDAAMDKIFIEVDLDNPSMEIKSAIILCFNQISKFFIWDNNSKSWYYDINNEISCSNFIDLLEKNPIENPDDKLIFSRMLVEIAMADEELVKEEEEFLNTYLPQEYSSFHELFAMPRLTKEDLLSVSEIKIREVMLMICWAIALTDQNLDVAEYEKLHFYADAFGITESRFKKLKYFSQEYIIEKLVEQLYHLVYEEKELIVSLNHIAVNLINSTAKNIGVSLNDVEAIVEKNKVRLTDEITLNLTSNN